MLQEEGCEIVRGVLDEMRLAELRRVLAVHGGAGQRGLLCCPLVRDIARSRAIIDIMHAHLGTSVRAVRAIFFDKTAFTNWLVPWHQDLTIAVHARFDVEGFGPWSIKGGVHHVQPPVAILEQMLTIRLHLDDCDVRNGALMVIPRSHRAGRLDASAIQQWRGRFQSVLCEAKAGDALLMRPLLLHASSRSLQLAGHRRILHIEYAACHLPAPLEWHEATTP